MFLNDTQLTSGFTTNPHHYIIIFYQFQFIILLQKKQEIELYLQPF